MKDLRDRLLAWKRGRYGPDESFGPGASPEAFAEAEAALGVALPADVREAFALHDPFWLPVKDELLSLAEIVNIWNHYVGDWSREPWGAGNTPEGPIRPDWWNRRWIPITFNQGNCHFLDLDPAEGGTLGQVCDYDIEGPRTRLIAPNYRAWAKLLVTDLEQGVIQI
ncbi:SMI1/KNR4 family protein [Zavarzinella formosa]|uniref:SMI1/KNR4 family protein n=1 Tax=Zavarzinella formosa TaxID=360055 RepID=UPI0003142516|nr:SMI1/KNR4 family protein [Zavarzinella formosa]